MIKQITLYNHDYGLSDNKIRGKMSRTWYLCGRTVREYFDLPENCGRVTFTAYERTSVNRVKFELTTARNDIGAEWTIVSIDGRPQYYFQFSTHSVIIELLQKHGTFYVGCEYE